MASPGAGAPGTLPPGMGANGALYVIFNSGLPVNNRYIGKSANLLKRFTSRMLTVNELGLKKANLAGIYAYWGTVSAYNTPPPGPLPVAIGVAAGIGPAPNLHTLMLGPPPGVHHGFRIIRNAFGAAPPMDLRVVGLAGPAINYAVPAVTTTIDGKVINVEALLIRVFRQMGVGGTITNGMLIGPFTNTLAHELIVQIRWAAGGLLAAHICISIPALGSI